MSPRVWIACLAAYNNGKLHGAWFMVPTDVETMQECINKVLRSSPEPNAEEWAIHDYEGFGEYNPGENPDLETLCLAAELVEEHGEIILDYAGHVGNKIDDRLADKFQDAYCGQWKSMREFAEETFRECYTIPEYLEHHIDWESVEREFEYDHFEVVGGHIFRNI